MSKDKKNILSVLETEIEEIIAECNKALLDNDLAALEDAETRLKEKELEYAGDKATEIYDELLKEENPIKAAVIRFSFQTITHVVNREEGKVIDYEMTTKPRQIDLEKFCKYGKLPLAWSYAASRLNKLLCMSLGNELGLTPEKLNHIRQRFLLEKDASRLELGLPPESVQDVCKLLQEVIDLMVFEPNAKGKNSIKCNNHHAKFLLVCHSKKGSQKLTVTVANNKMFKKLVMETLHAILTRKNVSDDGFDIVFKASKESETDCKAASECKTVKPAKKAKTAKVSENEEKEIEKK